MKTIPPFFGRSFYVFPVLLMLLAPLLTGCGEPAPKSPTEKQAGMYLNRIINSSKDLEDHIHDLAGAKRLNTRERLTGARTMVDQARKTLARADRDISNYIDFIHENQGRLKAENLEEYILIIKLFNADLREKRQTMGNYFAQIQYWLDYARTHFEKLKAGDVQSKRSYDTLFVELDRSFNRYESANKAYHEFVHEFFQQHTALMDRFKSRYKRAQKELGWS